MNVPESARIRTSAGVVALGASSAAGLVHAALATAHGEESSLAVAAFLGIAAAQLVVPLAAAAYGSWWWKAVAALNLIAVGAYVAALLGAAPLLHDGPEEFTLLGGFTVAIEFLAIVGALDQGSPLRTRPQPGAAITAGVLILAGVVGVGLTPTHGHSEVVVTAEQQARADALIAETTRGVLGFEDVAAAEAAGYVWIGDGRKVGGYRHYIQADYVENPTILDASQIESLVYQTQEDGSLTLVSAMYVLPLGDTMADVPDVAGDLTVWHDHAELCWDADGSVVRVSSPEGCAQELRMAIPPMLHVWVIDNPAGPFAGIEGHGEESGSSHSH